jgi:hypothetical protein
LKKRRATGTAGKRLKGLCVAYGSSKIGSGRNSDSRRNLGNHITLKLQ